MAGAKMGSTTASAGSQLEQCTYGRNLLETIHDSIIRLTAWLEKNNYAGYDTFDGLNARFLRPLTFENKLLRQVLQQGVRRFPFNLRPLLGVRKSRSTKGMAFLARGFIRLHALTHDRIWEDRACMALQWLLDNQSPGYSGACWGNHFDYQSRSGFEKQLSPSVVWTSLIGHAFLDAYQQFHDEKYLKTAISSCQHIERDLGAYLEGDALCIHYFPTSTHQVHNANTLGASLLARTSSYTHSELWRELAAKAMLYTARYQRKDASWYYGQAANLHWVDNFHTAYVLDCFHWYGKTASGDLFDRQMMDGYWYWKKTFFLSSGAPRYYNHKTLPLDIQCSSQAIDTLVLFRDRDPDSLSLAMKVAQWTIDNMQDPTGYFYYRRYSRWVVNKTPTLHWGQATMLCALAGLYQALSESVSHSNAFAVATI
jgi:polysaccharide biosynthesis protein VpsJ